MSPMGIPEGHSGVLRFHSLVLSAAYTDIISPPQTVIVNPVVDVQPMPGRKLPKDK